MFKSQGGNSFASYENIRTSIRMYHNHDKTENVGRVDLSVEVYTRPDMDVCAGGVSTIFMFYLKFLTFLPNF